MTKVSMRVWMFMAVFMAMLTPMAVSANHESVSDGGYGAGFAASAWSFWYWCYSTACGMG